MKKTFLMVVIALAMSYSCNDDENTPQRPEKETKSYMPLEAGNYWIYDVYYVPGDGTEVFHFKDTLTVQESIKTIRGKKYNTLVEKKGKINFTLQFHDCITTDSLGYIVTDNGKAIFSNINFTDTIYNHFVEMPNEKNSYRMAGIMKKIDSPYIVPAGKFNEILDFERSVYMASLPPSNEPGWRQNPKFVHTYYAKDIGIVFHTSIYLGGGEVIEWRLVKYHINGKTYPQE